MDERRDGAIGLEREPLEISDSCAYRVQTQLRDQQSSDPAPLPGVDDLDRGLGYGGILRPHVVRSSGGRRRRASERDHTSVIPAIETRDDREIAI